MRWLDDLMQDGHLALRMLVRAPAFAATSVITLALGIGLSVAMVTVSDAVLRRPLPVQDQDRVVVLWGEAEGSIRRLPLTYEHFERFREAPHTMQEVAGVLSPRAWPHAVRHGDEGLSLNLAAVTGNFFTVLGTPPILGRLLEPDDDVPGAPRVTVISHGLWQRYFAGDPGVLGRTITLHEYERAYTVVGVAPPGLEYPTGAEFWVPLRVLFTRLEVVPIARLAPGASPAQAAAELRGSFQREASVSWRHLQAVATPLPELIVGEVRPALRLLLAATVLILLISCFNVANLLLARATTRTQEMAVRRALGAPQARIVGQLLTESGLLALAGGILGTVLAGVMITALLALAPPELPRLEEIRLAGTPLRWALIISAAAAFTFGLLPALLAPGILPSSMRGDRTSSEALPRRRLQNALVVSQVGLSIVVLVAAGLLGRSLLHLQRVETGFATESVAIVELAWPRANHDSTDAAAAFRFSLYDRLLPRLEALPGVASAALMHLLPFGGASVGIDGRFLAEGRAMLDPATAPMFSMEVVGPGYFRTLGIPLLRGRTFTEADRENSPRAIVVTEGVARVMWPGEDAVGRRLGMGQPERAEDWWTVVGIVPDTRYRELREPTPTVYVPVRQFMSVDRIAIRTTVEPAVVLPSVRHAVQEMDPDAFVTSAHTMEGLMARELAQPRLSTALLGVFGVGALVLTGVGLYAMLAYMVRRRSRELAIRHALGASPARLRSLVLRQAIALGGTGVLVGLAVSLAGGRWIETLLFGTSPTDAATLVGVAVLVMTVVLAAAYFPCRRATETDPAAVLRLD
jgi:putative ABC transport system permease protein